MAGTFQLVLSVLFFPVTLLASWIVVHPNEHVVLLRWGAFDKLLDQPGLYWNNIWGRKAIRISTKRQAEELHKSVVADGNGNPILIGAVVTYEYRDTKKTALDVENPHEFVMSQAQAVLKRIAAKYPYEAAEGHNLKGEADEIGVELVAHLQEQVARAGAVIHRFQLSDLTYAPEIAQAMLIRQQAKALVDARRTIVDGAVEIVHDAVERLSERDFHLDDDQRARLIVNLLTVVCGDAKVQPTYPITSPFEGESRAKKDRNAAKNGPASAASGTTAGAKHA